MERLGMISWFSYTLPIEYRLQKIKETGFDAVSLWWSENDKDRQPELVRKIGLDIDNIHTPFDNANDLWVDNLAGEEYLETLISCVNDCKKHDIPVAVIHITGFYEPPAITATGVDRIKKLVHHAEKQEINLAFENLNYLEHLDYIFQNVDSNRLGFCYDSGHENCFHAETDCLSRYGEKLFAIHLHDNFGDSDDHLLPYYGTADWEGIKKRLFGCEMPGYITIEAGINPVIDRNIAYKGLSVDEFLALAYVKLQKFVDERK